MNVNSALSFADLDSALTKGREVPKSRCRLRYSCRFVALRYRYLQVAGRGRRRPRPPAKEIMLQVANRSAVKAKWNTLQHNGPLFPSEYERLPEGVYFYYDDCPIELTEQAEEVATFYAKLLKTPFVQQSLFNQNFFKDFRNCLTTEQRRHITCFRLCNFKAISSYLEQHPENSTSTKHDEERHGYCLVNGERYRVSNFRINQPGLCLPRHSISLTMGKISPRILPEDVIINCDEQQGPPLPPFGYCWGRVLHDRTVNWLYCWKDFHSNRLHYAYPQTKSLRRSRVPHRKELETARRLQQHIHFIRREYTQLLSSEHWLVRQRSVALYCIDMLAMGCDAQGSPLQTNVLMLRVADIKLHPRLGSMRNVLQLVGEVYKRSVSVIPEVYYNLSVFMSGKEPQDLVFDRLTLQVMREHLDYLMDGLTAKTFHIHNASKFLEDRLIMIPLQAKLSKQIAAYRKALKAIKKSCGTSYPIMTKLATPRRPSKLPRDGAAEKRKLNAICQRTKPLVGATMGYLDPRITIAWCLRRNISLTDVYSSCIIRRKLGWATKRTTKYFCF